MRPSWLQPGGRDPEKPARRRALRPALSTARGLVNAGRLVYSRPAIFWQKQGPTPRNPGAGRGKRRAMPDPPMALSRNVVVINEFGLHARSAARIAKVAKSAQSGIWVSRGADRADATSILELLGIA